MSTTYSISKNDFENITANQSLLSTQDILTKAKEFGQIHQLPYAGGIEPIEAWTLFQRGDAILIDVRTAEEFKFVGHVPGSKQAAWMTGANLVKNPRFIKEVSTIADKNAIILLLCRSGKRSAAAAEAAARAGFGNVFNVLEGFEGDLDDQGRRGENGGWRFYDLPWVQD